MRKLLLASAGLLGLAAGTAQAAVYGSDIATFPGSGPVATASAFNAPQVSTVAPGKVVVHLGGLVAVDAAVISADEDKGGATPANSQAKNAGYGLAGYFRLYFGADGRMANGLIYGAEAEMRTLFAGQTPTGYANSNVTSGGPTPIGNASANSQASVWYTRRAYGYIGGDTWGLVRIGQTDGPLSLFTGNGITTGEAYDTGQWNGDVCDFLSNGCVDWAFNDTGNSYTSDKLVYMSPSFAGFAFGASYAPAQVALSGAENANASTGGNGRQSTSVLTSDIGRARDTFELAARYNSTLGPLGVDAMIGYQGSGVVKNGIPGSTLRFRDVSMFEGGASVTFAGFSPFAHVLAGNRNGVVTPEQVLATRRQNDLAWIEGIQYTNGPYTVGASYYTYQNQGSAGGTGNRIERGLDVGGTYLITPGLKWFLSYNWGSRHQAGVNYVDPLGPATQHNTDRTSVVMTSMVWTW